MDQIKELMATQLTEQEIMIFLLVEDGSISTHKLAKILLTNQSKIQRTYTTAKKKLNTMSKIFVTDFQSKL